MGLEVIEQMKKKQGLTNEDLAKMSGVPKGTIDKITSGVTKDPKLETVKAIARALGCTIDDFSDFKPVRNLSAEEWEHVKKYRSLDDHGRETVDYIMEREKIRVDQLNTVPFPHRDNIIPLSRSIQKTSAGTGVYLGPEEMETIYVEDNALTRRASFCVPVSGDSMEPTYHDGDVLLVEGCEDIPVGQIGVFTVDGDGYVKQRGNGELISLNPAYAPIPLTEDSWCNGLVIGILDPKWIVEG